MKKWLGLALTILFFPGSIQAQNVGTIQPIVGGGKGDTFIGAPGDYNMNQITQDNTRVMLEILKQTEKIQEIDRAYLMGVVERLNAHLADLIGYNVKFHELAQKAALEYVDFQEYLTLLNKIRAKNEILETEILTQTLITRETLPSYDPLEFSGVNGRVPNYGNIDMSPVMTKVDAVRAKLIAEMNAVPFYNLVTPVGQRITITENALSPDLRGLNILTAQQIQQYEDEIKELITLSRPTYQYQRNYTDRTVTLILNFVKSYGKDEWLRFTNDNDGRARAEAFTQITDAFYRRSYLRKKYGIRMGAIQSRGYPKQIANVETFGFQLQPVKVALESLRREPAENDIEVQNAFEAARNFVELYDAKITPIFASRDDILSNPDKSLEYSSPDTGFLVRANSAITYVTGQRRTAEALLMIMRLILSDIREEMMLLQNDHLAMANYHDAKYRATAEMKVENNIKICTIDWTLPMSTHQSVCEPLGVRRKAQRPTSTTGTSIQEIFSNLLAQYENVERARRQEATFKQELITAARQSLYTDEDLDGLGDLFN